MAVPASFPESNGYLGKPPDMAHDQCVALSVLRTLDTAGMPVVISCHKFTQEELDEITRTGRVWLGVVGETMPPVYITGLRPF